MFLMNESPYVGFTLKSEDFRTLAIRLHQNQSYGEFQYPIHLSAVETTLVDYGFNSYEYRAAAWLHDIIEDCGVSPQFIQQYYGTTVANFVYACTGEGKTRAERNECIYQRLQKRSEAAPVKVADRLVNMKFGILNKSSQLKKYVDEFPEFTKRVRPLMFDFKGGMIMWNDLEDIYEQAKRLLAVG